MEVVDLFNDSAVRRAAYINNFKNVSFVNDTNNPSNCNFVKHGDPKSFPLPFQPTQWTEQRQKTSPQKYPGIEKND